MLALPIFPVSHPTSIVGEGVLNFCVRDGNRWTHTPINTNLYSVSLSSSSFIVAHDFHFVKNFFLDFFGGDPYRIRTDVNGVRGRCLNHLTNGPYLLLYIKHYVLNIWCTFTDSNRGPTD